MDMGIDDFTTRERDNDDTTIPHINIALTNQVFAHEAKEANSSSSPHEGDILVYIKDITGRTLSKETNPKITSLGRPLGETNRDQRLKHGP